MHSVVLGPRQFVNVHIGTSMGIFHHEASWEVMVQALIPFLQLVHVWVQAEQLLFDSHVVVGHALTFKNLKVVRLRTMFKVWCRRASLTLQALGP